MVLRDLAPDVFRFGHFTLEPQRRLLSIDGRAIALSSRAFDILLLLVEQRERVVTKDEIFASVWPGTIVEENNLAVQISALRRALGEPPGDPKLIITVPGRGYRFVGTLEEESPLSATAAAEPPPDPPVIDPVPPRPRRVSRPALALAACALILAILGARYEFRGTYNAPRLSIAVLPFRNLSGDPQQDYLADAISDDLTTDLSHIPGSAVIARESADTYKNHPAPSPEIGRALNVRYLLEGSLRAEANTIHVNAQLIDAQTSAHLWAARFDVARDKLGAAQEDIVRHIASALNFTLVQVEAARSLHDRPDKPDAVDLYLRARSVLDQGATKGRLKDARRLLEQAVALAPSFVDAQAELALVLLRNISDFGGDNLSAEHAESRTAISAALSHNMLSPVALVANGMLAWEDYRCDQALPNFTRALELDPNEVRAMEGAARCSRELGHMAEMIAQLKRILTIDPVGPGNSERQQLIGFGYLILGQPSEAVNWFNRAAIGMGDNDDPQAPPLDPREWRRLYLIASAWMLGDKPAAAKLYEQYAKRYPHRTSWRIASFFTRAMAELPGSKAFLSSLEHSGMPAFADEAQDFGVEAKGTEHAAGDFDPTPMDLPGGNRIDANTLRDLRRRTPAIIILDLGRGACVVRGAHWVWAQGFEADPNVVMRNAIDRARVPKGTPIIVMSDSLFGWDSYNAALNLIARGYQNVLWFRGGEESWASHGYDSDDLRPM